MIVESNCEQCRKPVAHKQDKRCKHVFCSSSCAASYNNARKPKRAPQHKCKICGGAINCRRRYCEECRSKRTSTHNKTYGELCKYSYQKNSRIREDARRVYTEAQLPRQCIVCGYAKYFEVCHVVDISTFTADTLVSTINRLDNLVPLCKNHHWEFDHDQMLAKDLKKIERFIASNRP